MLPYNIKIIIFSIILGALTLIYNVRITKGENYIYLYNMKVPFVIIHFNIFIHGFNIYL